MVAFGLILSVSNDERTRAHPFDIDQDHPDVSTKKELDPAHRNNLQEFKKLYARFQQNRDLISVGAYAPGSDEDTDRAIAKMPEMRRFLQQGMDERVPMPRGLQQLADLFESPGANSAAPSVPITAQRRMLRAVPAN